eukprot:1160465-Pelagomonas_calceolata.AAC.4
MAAGTDGQGTTTAAMFIHLQLGHPITRAISDGSVVENETLVSAASLPVDKRQEQAKAAEAGFQKCILALHLWTYSMNTDALALCKKTATSADDDFPMVLVAESAAASPAPVSAATAAAAAAAVGGDGAGVR